MRLFQFFSFDEMVFETYLPQEVVVKIMKAWIEEPFNPDEIRFYELDKRTKFIGKVEIDRFELVRNIKLQSGNFKDSSITPKITGQIISKAGTIQLKMRFTTGKIAGWIYTCLILIPLLTAIIDIENFDDHAFLGFVFFFGISLFYFGEKGLIIYFMKKELALKKPLND